MFDQICFSEQNTTDKGWENWKDLFECKRLIQVNAAITEEDGN